MNPFSIPFNVAVNHITGKLLPRGFDVSENAPSTLESLTAHYQETGRILVWNGASDQTIFDCAETNFAFRAWHDLKHVNGKFAFDRRGEYNAYVAQCCDIHRFYDGAQAREFCRILYAEIMGQFDYNAKFGGFPVDQMAFCRAFLADSVVALRKPAFGISPES